jgi:hypothetical protein
MCAACIEYTKEKLNVNELKSALRETTMDNPKHYTEVDGLIQKHGSNPKELKKEIEKILTEK